MTTPVPDNEPHVPRDAGNWATKVDRLAAPDETAAGRVQHHRQEGHRPATRIRAAVAAHLRHRSRVCRRRVGP